MPNVTHFAEIVGPDMRQMAARLGVEHLMRTVWLSAYLAGWRAGTAREWPTSIDGAEVLEPEQ